MILRKHNLVTYDNIVKLFLSNNRVAAVQPTGTGKSYLILQLINDNRDKLFAVLSPSNYIFSHLTRIAEEYKVSLENVTFLTYQKLTLNVDILNEDFDYIVLDEFHRCGAELWGQGVNDLLTSVPNAKVFGTSATPIRYLDSGRNMAEELFNGVYAVNMSLAEAINKKILPLPIYVTSWYSFRGDIEQLEIRAEQTQNPRLKKVLMGKLQKAKSMIAGLDVGIEKIFEKHIPNRSGKYIVFCPNVEQLRQMTDDCDSWFAKINDNIHKYTVYSQNSSSEKQFEEFREDSSDNALKLLFCVDMLNEGVHFNDIDGVIMLRATKSANVFYQQLGRALACSESRTYPVIFDIVNNFETGDTAQQYASIMEITRESGSYDDEIEFELYDYVRDIREILRELNDTFSNSWDFNFELLKEYVEKNAKFPDGNTSYEGVMIGKFVLTQRVLRKQKKLSRERIDKLNSIDFPWDSNESYWQSMLAELEQFTKRLGHFPKRKEFPDDKKYIFAWVERQRVAYRNGLLEPHKVEKLTSLGCDMTVTNLSNWNERFEQLKRFLEENDRFPENSDTTVSDELKTLVIWMNSQRKSYLNGKLLPEHQKKLESIGFHWSVQDDEWNKNFDLLKNFYVSNLRLPTKREAVDGVKIGAWYGRQAFSYRKGELSEERVQRFREANIPLGSVNEIRKQVNWSRLFKGYESFMESHGKKPEVNDTFEGISLYKWSYRQVQMIRDGQLNADQITKLAQVGITADGR